MIYDGIKLGKIIGKGATGVVYKANGKNGETWAVKEIQVDDSCPISN